MSQLSDAIKEIVKEYLSSEKLYSHICQVISVDETNRTCELEPINGDAQRTGRIQANLELSEGLYIKPVLNSYVHLSFINNLTGIITGYSEIEELDITVGGSSLNIIDGQVTFNGGSLGGLAVPSKVVTRLNNIEQDVNDLKTAFTNWVTVPNDGGAALKTITATWYGSQLTETQESDIDNTEIKQ